MAILSNIKQYIIAISQDIKNGKKHNKTTVEKLAAKYEITNKNEVKEFTELAIVNIARSLAHSPNKTIKQRYESIVGLYLSQVNLSQRTSESIRMQQYSTPAPIAYLAGVFCGFNKKPENYYYFEPSAGNGLLTIAGKPHYFIVNELDEIRLRNLKTQGFDTVFNSDASKPFHADKFVYDAVITNPPFGSLPSQEKVGTLQTKVLDHAMAAIALETMRHDGKAAIIIGGHTKWDPAGRIQKGKNRDFFVWLYKTYNVVDVINIDGHALYSRQGTAFNVRLILIDGRGLNKDAWPPGQKITDVVVNKFDQLYKRIMQHVNQLDKKPKANKQKLIAIAKAKLALSIL